MCTWKECVFFFGEEGGYNVLKNVKSIVLFRISVALLISCFKDLSTDVSGLLKSPTIIVFLPVSPFMSFSIYFMYLSTPILGTYMLMCVISFPCIDPSLILYSLCLELHFVLYEYCDPCFLIICLHEISFSIPSLSIYMYLLP